RNVRLTPIGRVFLEHMEKAVNVIQDAVQVVEEYNDPELGTIHIGYPSSLATYILPTAISAFRDRYPEVKFQLNQGSYYDLKEAVIKGERNMAILGPLPQKEKKLHTSILFTESLMALIPVSHPLSGSSSITLNQLREDAFILFPEGYVLRDLIFNACQQLGFTPK